MRDAARGQALPRFTRGWPWPGLQLGFLFSLARCALQPRRFPLFRLGARAGGALATFRLLDRLHRTKLASFRGHVYPNVERPRRPSLAHDAWLARGGLSLAAAGTPGRTGVDVAMVALTRRCRLGCVHCYERVGGTQARDLPRETWARVIEGLQEFGVGVLVLTGGEPLLRFEDVLALGRLVDKQRSDLHLHTAGDGATPERARSLAEAGLVAVGIGLDDPDPARNDRLRGRAGAHRMALAALGHFLDAGVFPYLNTCLTSDLVRRGGLHDLLDLARREGAGVVRLLEPRACGALGGHDTAELFSPADREAVVRFLAEANRDARWRRHPVVEYPAHDERPENLGCRMGGLSLLHVDAGGHVRPCPFLPVSFGSVETEPLGAILGRMRAAVPRPLRIGCPAVALAGTLNRLSPDGAAVPVESIQGAWDQVVRRADPGRRAELPVS